MAPPVPAVPPAPAATPPLWPAAPAAGCVDWPASPPEPDPPGTADDRSESWEPIVPEHAATANMHALHASARETIFIDNLLEASSRRDAPVRSLIMLV
jgi:hypothetical protein